jgi:hypothetical protein
MAREREAGESAEERLASFVAAIRGNNAEATALLDSAAVQIFEAFGEAGVSALLLKGAALAQMLYGPGEQRVFADVDLLIAPADVAEAEAILAGLGYRNGSESLGIDDVGGVVHADMWLGIPPGAPHQIVVELHRWFPGARAAPPDAWREFARHQTSIDLLGRPVPVLDRPGQALQLATHAAQHGLEYVKGLRELALAIERWRFDVWRDAATLAEQIQATDTFAAGLRLIPEGAALAETLGLPADSRLEWEIRNRAQRPRGTFHVEALRDSKGIVGRLSILRRALFPSSRWLAVEFGWARRSRAHLAAAYALHTLRAPLWATRAWAFRRRARRSDSRSR